MSARHTIVFGSVAILILASLLVWLRLPNPQVEASPDRGHVAGLSVVSQNGVDHLVEHHTGPAGYTSLEAELAAINVTLNPEDHYVAMPDPSFGIGSSIEITRATPVTIFDGGTALGYRTWSATVKDLLAEQHIHLGSDDRIDPKLETPLRSDLKISITRVGITQEVESEPIAHKTLTKTDDTLEKGTNKVRQVGKDGVRKKTYQVTRENGQVTERKLVNNEVSSQPLDRIEVIGTKVVVYGTGQATWYALRHGFGAASNTLPHGTKVHVVNLDAGRSVDVTIDDHGIQGSAIIDLDQEAFAQIAPLGAGRIQVRLEKVY